MAGNKFRNFRPEKKKGKEGKIDIEKNSKIKLLKDIDILTKPKDDEKYQTKCICKKGSVLKVVDIIKNKDIFFLKIEYRNNDEICYGYIPFLDKEGNKNIEKYVEKKENEKNKEKKKNSRLVTFGSIRLSEAQAGIEKTPEDVNCVKKATKLKDKIIDYLSSQNPNQSPNANLDIEDKKKMVINYYLIILELNKFEKENNLDKIEDQKSFLELQQ